jgi:hypothetical protein
MFPLYLVPFSMLPVLCVLPRGVDRTINPTKSIQFAALQADWYEYHVVYGLPTRCAWDSLA